ncbi:hypothetical protein AC249_AIPGENE8427, partial [Exaiptasia diaphana]
MKPFPFFPSVHSPQLANFLLIAFLCLHAWTAWADSNQLHPQELARSQTSIPATLDGQNTPSDPQSATKGNPVLLNGLPAAAIGAATLENGPNGSLIVTPAGIEGGATISSGSVQGLITTLAADVLTAEEFEGIRSTVAGWVEGSIQSLGHLDLATTENDAPAVEAIPNFSGWQAAGYELTLLHEDAVVFQYGGFSDSAGELVLGESPALTVEWLSHGLAVLTGFVEATPSSQPEEP